MWPRIQRDTGFEESVTPRRFRTTVLTDLYDQTKDVKQAQAAAEERRMAEQQLADSLAQSALEEAAEPAEEQPAGNDNEGFFD